MKTTIACLVLLMSLVPLTSHAESNGLISKKSKYTVTETINRLENVLKSKGITIAMRWSHSDRAKGVNIPLRPTELLVFGNPKLGSHFFTSQQTAGLDLPLKALAWQDKDGTVWLSYNDPSFIANRHDIKDREEIVKKMTGALNKFSNIATGNK